MFTSVDGGVATVDGRAGVMVYAVVMRAGLPVLGARASVEVFMPGQLSAGLAQTVTLRDRWVLVNCGGLKKTKIFS